MSAQPQERIDAINHTESQLHIAASDIGWIHIATSAQSWRLAERFVGRHIDDITIGELRRIIDEVMQ